MYNNLKYEVKDGICYITINRPQAMNALNDEVLDELALSFRRRVDHLALRVERADGLIEISLRDLVRADGGQYFGFGGESAGGKSERDGQRGGRETVQFRHDG